MLEPRGGFGVGCWELGVRCGVRVVTLAGLHASPCSVAVCLVVWCG